MSENNISDELGSYEMPCWGEPADYCYLLDNEKNELVNEISGLEKSRAKKSKIKALELKRRLLLLRQMSMNQFAWEFLRRNKNYHEDFNYFANQSSLDGIKSQADNNLQDQASKDESHGAMSKRVCHDKSDLASLAKIGDFFEKYDLQPHADIASFNPNNRNGPGFYSLDSEYPIMKNSKRSSSIGYSLRQDFKDELVVKINVLLPLDEQFSKIRATANRMASQFESLSQYKDNDKLYVLYLRLLDAIEQGAKETEIYFYLYHNLFYMTKEEIEKEKIFNQEEIKEKRFNQEEINENIIPSSYEDFIRDRDGLSFRNFFPMEKFDRKFRLDKKNAEALRDGGYVSLAKSVSHYINQTLPEKERRIDKKF